MKFNLSRKNAAGKWWTYGSMAKNQWGNNQVSFKVGALKDLIELAEGEKKEWVNLSVFENKGVGPKQEEHSVAKGNAYVKEPDMGDEIPFN